MHGRGMCMVGGWQGGMHGKGHAWQGGVHGMHGGVTCMAGGMRCGRDSHCSGRYASYWNSFLFDSAIHKAAGLMVPGRSMICLVLFHCSTVPTVKPSMGEQPLGVVPATGILGNGR